jgi:hypothetical protein
MLFHNKRTKNKKFSKIRNFRQILVEIKIYFNLNKYPRKLKSLFKMQDNKIKINLILISLLDYNHNKKRMMKNKNLRLQQIYFNKTRIKIKLKIHQMNKKKQIYSHKI